MKHDQVAALRAFVIMTRQEQGLSQADVASRGGFPKGTLGAFEAGKRGIPRQETLQGIAKGLGVKYEALDRILRGLPPFEKQAAAMNAIDEITDAVDRLPLDALRRSLLKKSLGSLIDAFLEDARFMK